MTERSATTRLIGRSAEVLGARGTSLAAALVASPAWAAGARVALWLPPDALVEAVVACLHVGAVVVPVAWRHGARPLAHHVRDAGAAVLVTDTTRREVVVGATIPMSHRVLFLDALSPGTLPTAAPRMDDEVALLSYAEDVAERPRAVVHTQASLALAVEGTARALALHEGDRLVTAVALAQGALTLALAAQCAGARAWTLLPPTESTLPPEAIGAATVLVLEARALARHAAALAALPTLRLVVGVGGAVPRSLGLELTQAAEREGRALECASALVVRDLPLLLAIRSHARSSGVATPVREGRLDGVSLEVGDDETLRLRGPAIPPRCDAQDETRLRFDEAGWFRCRDRVASDGPHLVARSPDRAPSALDGLDAALPPATPEARAWVGAHRLAYPIGCGRGASLALAHGLKPMLRELLPVTAIDAARQRFEADGFATLVSPLAFGPTRDGWLGREISREDAPRASEEERRPLYVGRDETALREAVDAELSRSAAGARLLGELLGYPACCVEAFVAHDDRRAARLWHAAAARSVRFAPRLNVLDHAIFSFVSFFPCRFDCPAALAQANALAALVGATHPDFVQAVDAALARARLVLAPEVQLAIDGSCKGNVFTVEAIHAAACDRDPRVPLDPREEDVIARALVWLRAPRTLTVREGMLFLDGRACPLPLEDPLPLLIPFGE